jgi:hypothetical protein
MGVRCNSSKASHALGGMRGRQTRDRGRIWGEQKWRPRQESDRLNYTRRRYQLEYYVNVPALVLPSSAEFWLETFA